MTMNMKLLAMVVVIVLTCVSCGGGGNSAPLGVSAESADLFTYEFNAEYNGVVLRKYYGMKSSVKIPDKIDDLPVVGIGAECFAVGQVTEVYFPDTVKFFKWGWEKAAGAQNMEVVVIPQGVTEIVDAAFYQFRSLKSVTIPDSVTEIGDAFNKCISLTNVEIPDSVTKIDLSAFKNCTSLTNATYKGVSYKIKNKYENNIEYSNSLREFGIEEYYLPQEFYDAVNGK